MRENGKRKMKTEVVFSCGCSFKIYKHVGNIKVWSNFCPLHRNETIKREIMTGIFSSSTNKIKERPLIKICEVYQQKGIKASNIIAAPIPVSN